ncbi:DNA internalization-related competence protein ComEC/Rec2 [Paenibacillus guangzhouensis]|uniref:DNA internalization-related competence protein ComEC/Rec2 n=1 Tax=Paenibacillus guangzhouensis TaxID=1473112 RepID=UPI001266D027|nr:DNA internalization-related competence protein ComEC/Rec2 [Paenibacillus guangzhouensis]
MIDRRPLVGLVSCFVLGTGFASMWQGTLLMMIGCGVLFIGIPLLLWMRAASVRLAMLCGAAVIFGILNYWWADQRNTSQITEMIGQAGIEAAALEAVQGTGIIDSKVEVDGDRVSFVLRLHQLSVGGKLDQQALSERVMVQVQLTEQTQQTAAGLWQRGDTLRMTGSLSLPAVARNFDSFDYRAYLRLKRIHYTLRAKGLASIQVASASGWNEQTLLRINDKLREQLGNQMSGIFAPPHDGYMKGLVIGDSGDLDPEKFRDFSKLGLTHILAISGTHVAVYVGFFLWLFRRLRLTRETSLLIVIGLIPPYVLLSGASPSVIRAGIMAMISLYALRRQWLKDGLHILSLAAFLMLLWNPYQVLDVSFQLSFIVTAGLILWVPPLQRLLPIRSKAIASLVSITCVAQIVSFPVTIYYFNQVSWLSLIANFVLVPFISLIILPLGTFALAGSYIHIAAAKVLVWPTEWLNGWTFQLIEWLNASRHFIMTWPTPPVWWIVVYYGLIGLGFAHLNKMSLTAVQRTPAQAVSEEETVPLTSSESLSKRLHPNRIALRTILLRTSYFIAIALILVYAYQPMLLNREGNVQFIDVGQGDSILIRTPSGKIMLIDGGGTVRFNKPADRWKARQDPYEVGRKTLVPLLKQRGVQQIDVLIMTHEDQDHAGGLQAVIEEIPVHAFVFNGTLKENQPISKLFRTAIALGIPLYAAGEPASLRMDDETSLTFLSPSATFMNNARITKMDEQNDASVAFLLHIKQSTFLFTGDMGVNVEQEILDRLGLEQGGSQRIDVLKVAHHGSKTSSSDAWLQFWRPQAAVISVGEKNLYGHPSPIVMERLQANRIQVFRTDQQGEIQMKVTNVGIQVRQKNP